jgi:hypothetical protein
MFEAFNGTMTGLLSIKNLCNGSDLIRCWGYAVPWRGNPFYFTISSADGSNWSMQSTSNYFDKCVYGNSTFVGIQGGYLKSSFYGDIWTPRATVADGTLIGLTYANGQFVAVGVGKILSSRDGIEWRERKVLKSFTLRSIACGGGHFVAVGDYGLILRSGLLQLELEPVSVPKGGPAQGWVRNPSGSNCVIQTSGNLTDWTVLTNVTIIDNTAQFVDPFASNITQRFYRAVQAQ